MNPVIATDFDTPRCLPAAATGRSDASYELKFLLPDSLADELLAWARVYLAADPHADHSLGDGYRVNSLYFDTADLDVYRRVGWGGRRKFRLRRYGGAPHVFLERKSKTRGLVRKRRTVVPESDLAVLETATLQPGWPGHWFHRRVLARRLAPKCQVAYLRIARVGMTSEGPVRLTVDRQVRCRPAAGLNVHCLMDGVPLLSGQSIVELKFRVAMPALFKAVVSQWSLCPTMVSKYRLSVAACGLDSDSPRHSPNAGAPDGATGIATPGALRYA